MIGDGFVIVEIRRDGTPTMSVEEIHNDVEDALDQARQMGRDMAAYGRPETYRVAHITFLKDVP